MDDSSSDDEPLSMLLARKDCNGEWLKDTLNNKRAAALLLYCIASHGVCQNLHRIRKLKLPRNLCISCRNSESKWSKS